MAGRVDRVGRSRRKRKAPVADWRGILTRVNPQGLAAFKERCKIHDLVMQGIDLALRKRSYPPIEGLKAGKRRP